MWHPVNRFIQPTAASSIHGNPITRSKAYEGLGDPATWEADAKKLEAEFKAKPTAASEEGKLFRCGGCGRLFPSESHATLCSHDSTENWIEEIQRENQSLTRKVEELERELALFAGDHTHEEWIRLLAERDTLRAELEQVRGERDKWEAATKAWITQTRPATEQELQKMLSAVEHERDATTAELKKAREALEKVAAAFRHVHQNNGIDDTCKICGLDLRNEVHLRSAQSAIKEAGK